MKKLVFVMMILFVASVAGAQEVFKKGTTVKGEEATYKVREHKRVPFFWVVQNLNNPDTTIKAIPRRALYTAQVKDIELQVAKIIYDKLTEEEVAKVDEALESFSVVLRVDREKHKLQQVTCFVFVAYEPKLGSPREAERPYDGFWLNFDPDRLREIEKAIVEGVEIPEQINESYLTDDIDVALSFMHFRDIDKNMTERQKAIEAWKADPNVDMEMPLYAGGALEI